MIGADAPTGSDRLRRLNWAMHVGTGELVDPGRTRVELEHRRIDRHGPGWEALAEGVGGDQGWPLYLARYAALFDEGR